MDAGVVRLVARTLARALVLRFQDGQVDVAVGQVKARARLAHFLETEHFLVEGRGLLGIRRPDSDVLDPGHARLPAERRARSMPRALDTVRRRCAAYTRTSS